MIIFNCPIQLTIEAVPFDLVISFPIAKRVIVNYFPSVGMSDGFRPGTKKF